MTHDLSHDAREHPVDRFFAWVDALPHDLYPPQLVPVAGRHLDGVSGFPAGRGLYAECGWDHRSPPPFPYGGLMLIGNHLQGEEPFVELWQRGEATGDPCPGATRMRFWTMLYALLDLARIPRSRIFVTNVHPALLRGRGSTGVVKSAPEWEAACAELLERQIEVMRPATIAVMGTPARQFVGSMLGVAWPTVPGVVVTEVAGRDTPVVAIRHPSAAQSVEQRDRTGAMLAGAFRDGSAEGDR